MKRSLIILLLTLLQSACSHQALAPQSTGTLLSFAEISAEISVRHEVHGPVVAEDATIAYNAGE